MSYDLSAFRLVFFNLSFHSLYLFKSLPNTASYYPIGNLHNNETGVDYYFFNLTGTDGYGGRCCYLASISDAPSGGTGERFIVNSVRQYPLGSTDAGFATFSTNAKRQIGIVDMSRSRGEN